MNRNDILNHDMAAVVDDALDALRTLLASGHDTRAAAELAGAVRLLAQVRHRLPDLVAEARDQDNSWAEISRLLGRSRLGTMARYGHHARTRTHPIDLD